ncbi:MAG TPA: translesion DNA synthesis-associated protein ImuA [Gammaproteobacteria bacterium]|nr:translesion DNA synthesis-associated protein ImuA [Gammaproteobacteria bacterium]
MPAEKGLDVLLQRNAVWRGGSRPVAAAGTVATGFPLLDEELAGGGWPRGALTELIAAQAGIGALRLLMPALARLARERRWICWVAPPHVPYAPALAAAGIDLSRILLVHPKAHQDGLWAVEQSLRSGTCGAVLCWPTLEDGVVLRRLQLAAEAGNALGFLFRSPRFARRPSPSALRLQLAAAPDGRLSVSILKRRGGWATGPLYLDPPFPEDGALALYPPAAAGAGSLHPR